MARYMHGGQSAFCRGWFSSPTMWVLEIELRSLDMVAKVAMNFLCS